MTLDTWTRTTSDGYEPTPMRCTTFRVRWCRMQSAWMRSLVAAWAHGNRLAA